MSRFLRKILSNIGAIRASYIKLYLVNVAMHKMALCLISLHFSYDFNNVGWFGYA